MYQITYRDMFGQFQQSQVFTDPGQAVDWCIRLGRLTIVHDARIEIVEGQQ